MVKCALNYGAYTIYRKGTFMRCPKCGFENSKVIDSRPTEETSSIRRRRECLKCKHRFTTYEYMEHKPIVVIKRNGSAEVFDRDKLYRGVLISCAKRPIDTKVIDSLIDEIEAELHNKGVTEIKASEIGEMVLNRLVDVDQVAYVRFASVYKDFSNVDEFKNALKGLK